MQMNHYSRFLVMITLHFIAMYIFMAISDRQFLRSMIPHHASAILMCNEARIQGQEIKDLCKNIITNQQAEIDQMKAMLDRMAK